jgi:copper chaperone CopZ
MEVEETSMETVLHSTNIHCEGCANTIRKALLRVGGIDAVDVDPAEKRVVVQHAAEVGRPQIAEAMAAVGYPETNGHAAAKATPAMGATDPVCGMTVDPAHAAVFEDALAGVQSGHEGGFGYVVGVDRAGQRDALLAHGASVVVDDLAELL